MKVSGDVSPIPQAARVAAVCLGIAAVIMGIALKRIGQIGLYRLSVPISTFLIMGGVLDSKTAIGLSFVYVFIMIMATIGGDTSARSHHSQLSYAGKNL